MTVDKIVRVIKSITARIVFQKYPKLKENLWGGNFWTSAYYANTVGQYDITISMGNISKQQIELAHVNDLFVTIWNINSKSENTEAINRNPDFI